MRPLDVLVEKERNEGDFQRGRLEQSDWRCYLLRWSDTWRAGNVKSSVWVLSNKVAFHNKPAGTLTRQMSIQIKVQRKGPG